MPMPKYIAEIYTHEPANVQPPPHTAFTIHLEAKTRAQAIKEISFLGLDTNQKSIFHITNIKLWEQQDPENTNLYTLLHISDKLVWQDSNPKTAIFDQTNTSPKSSPTFEEFIMPYMISLPAEDPLSTKF